MYDLFWFLGRDVVQFILVAVVIRWILLYCFVLFAVKHGTELALGKTNRLLMDISKQLSEERMARLRENNKNLGTKD